MKRQNTNKGNNTPKKGLQEWDSYDHLLIPEFHTTRFSSSPSSTIPPKQETEVDILFCDRDGGSILEGNKELDRHQLLQAYQV